MQNRELKTLLSSYADPTTCGQFRSQAWRVKDLVFGSSCFSTIMKSMKNNCDFYFQGLNHLIQEKNPLLKFLDAKASDILLITEQFFANICYQTLMEYHQRLIFWSTRHQALQSFSGNLQIGCFVLNQDIMINSLSKIPNEIGKQLNKSLPKVLNALFNHLSKLVEDFAVELNKEPNTLEMFMNWLTVYYQIDAQYNPRKELDECFQSADTLYHILEDINSKEAFSISHVHQIWKSKESEFEENTIRASVAKDGQKSVFVRLLSDEYEKLSNFVAQEMENLTSIQMEIVDHRHWKRDIELSVLQHLQNFEHYLSEEKSLIKLQELYGLSPYLPSLGIERILSEAWSKVHIRQEFVHFQSKSQAWLKSTLSSFQSEDIVLQCSTFRAFVENKQAILVGPTSNALLSHVFEQIDQMEQSIEFLQSLKDANMAPHYWNKIQNLLGFSFEFDQDGKKEETALEALIVKTTEIQKNRILNVCECAKKEARVLQSMESIRKELKGTPLTLIKFRYSYILEDFPIERLNDMIMELQVMLHDASPWKEEAITLYYHCVATCELMVDWKGLQDIWIYLAKISRLQSIRSQCEADMKEFDTADEVWRNKMRELRTYRVSLYDVKGQLAHSLIRDSITLCEKIASRLRYFLLSTRSQYGRFFFISDEELMDVLGNNDSISVIQKIIPKCFQNAQALEIGSSLKPESSSSDQASLNAKQQPQERQSDEIMFEEDDLVEHEMEPVTGIRCYPSLVLVFDKPVNRIGSLFFWLSRIDTEMHSTMQRQIHRACHTDDLGSMEWIVEFVPQVLFTAAHLSWCLMMQHILFDQSTIHDSQLVILDRIKSQMKAFIHMRQEIGHVTQMNLGMKFKLECLMLLWLYHRDSLEHFISMGFGRTFRWHCQFRFNESASSEYSCTFAHLSIPLGLEFSGQEPVPIFTPTTDRMYFALACAADQHIGTFVHGLPGVGKKSLVRTLANALLRLYLQLQCSELTQPRTLSNFVSGICQVGGWGSLVNFPRCSESATSHLMDNMRQIQEAASKKMTDYGRFSRCHLHSKLRPSLFVLHAKSSDIHSTVPSMLAWKDSTRTIIYQSFRPVSIPRPSLQMFVQLQLESRGFENPTLGKVLEGVCQSIFTSTRTVINLHLVKGIIQLMTEVFESPRYQLQKMKRQRRQQHSSNKNTSGFGGSIGLSNFISDQKYSEINILRYSIEEKCAPVMLSTPFILSSICDEYFGVRFSFLNSTPILREAVVILTKHHGLLPKESFVSKVLHLYHRITRQPGIILYGDECSGKSTCIQILAQAMNVLKSYEFEDENLEEGKQDQMEKKKHHIEIVHIPGQIFQLKDIYGYLDERTGRWINGILSTMLKRGDGDKWICFDGKMSIACAEILQNLIDGEPREMIMFNGERVRPASKQFCLFFESTQLDQMPPNLLTRCALMHISSSSIKEEGSVLDGGVISWVDLISAWAIQKKTLTAWNIDQTIQVVQLAGIAFYRENSDIPQYMNINILVSNTLTMLDVLLPEENVLRCTMSALKDNPTKSLEIQLCLTLIAVAWCFAGHLEMKAVHEYESYIEDLILEEDIFIPIVQNQGSGILESIFQVAFDWDQQHLVTWKQSASNKNNPDAKASAFTSLSNTDAAWIWVPDTGPIMQLCQKSLKKHQSIVVTGNSGCGKSAFLQELLRQSSSSSSKLISSTALYLNWTQNSTAWTCQDFFRRLSSTKKCSLQHSHTSSVDTRHKSDRPFHVKVFLDDMHYENPILEGCRQVFNNAGMFTNSMMNDGETSTIGDDAFKWIKMDSITFSMALQSMSSNDLLKKTTFRRFIRHALLFRLPQLDLSSIAEIIDIKMASLFSESVLERLVTATSSFCYLFQPGDTGSFLLSEHEYVNRNVFQVLNHIKRRCEREKTFLDDSIEAISKLWRIEIKHLFLDQLTCYAAAEDHFYEVLQSIQEKYWKAQYPIELYKRESSLLCLPPPFYSMEVDYKQSIQLKKGQSKADSSEDKNTHDLEWMACDGHNLSEIMKIHAVKIARAFDHGENCCIFSQGSLVERMPTIYYAAQLFNYKVCEFIPVNDTPETVGEMENVLETIITSIGFDTESQQMCLILRDILITSLPLMTIVMDLLHQKIPQIIYQRPKLAEQIQIQMRSEFSLFKEPSNEEVIQLLMQRVYEKLRICICMNEEVTPSSEVLKVFQSFSVPHLYFNVFPSFGQHELMEFASLDLLQTFQQEKFSNLHIEASMIAQKMALIHQASQQLNPATVTAGDFFTLLEYYQAFIEFFWKKFHAQDQLHHSAVDLFSSLKIRLKNCRNKYFERFSSSLKPLILEKEIIEQALRDIQTPFLNQLDIDLETVQLKIQDRMKSNQKIDKELKLNRMNIRQEMLTSMQQLQQCPIELRESQIQNYHQSQNNAFRRLEHAYKEVFHIKQEEQIEWKKIPIIDSPSSSLQSCETISFQILSDIHSVDALSQLQAFAGLDLPFLHGKSYFLHSLMKWFISLISWKQLQEKEERLGMSQSELEYFKQYQLELGTEKQRLEKNMPSLLESLKKIEEDQQLEMNRIHRECSFLQSLHPLEQMTESFLQSWTENKKKFDQQMKSWPLTLLLCCAELVYLGPVADETRQILRGQWMGKVELFGILDQTLDSFLVSNHPFSLFDKRMEMEYTHLYQLPMNRRFIDNATIAAVSKGKCPLISDPTGIAMAWIRACLSSNGTAIHVASADRLDIREWIDAKYNEGAFVILHNVDERHLKILGKYIQLGTGPYPELFNSLCHDGKMPLWSTHHKVQQEQSGTLSSFRLLFFTTQQTPMRLDKNWMHWIDFTGNRAAMESRLIRDLVQFQHPEFHTRYVESAQQQVHYEEILKETNDKFIQTLVSSNVVATLPLKEDDEHSTQMIALIQQFYTFQRQRRLLRSKYIQERQATLRMDSEIKSYQIVARTIVTIFDCASVVKHLSPIYCWSVQYLRRNVQWIMKQLVRYYPGEISSTHRLIQCLGYTLVEHFSQGLSETSEKTFQLALALNLYERCDIFTKRAFHGERHLVCDLEWRFCLEGSEAVIRWQQSKIKTKTNKYASSLTQSKASTKQRIRIHDIDNEYRKHQRKGGVDTSFSSSDQQPQQLKKAVQLVLKNFSFLMGKKRKVESTKSKARETNHLMAMISKIRKGNRNVCSNYDSKKKNTLDLLSSVSTAARDTMESAIGSAHFPAERLFHGSYDSVIFGSPTMWHELDHLAKVSSVFVPIIDHIHRYTFKWKDYVQQSLVGLTQDILWQSMPGPVSNLCAFRKLLIIRCLCPMAYHKALGCYIKEAMMHIFQPFQHHDFLDDDDAAPLLNEVDDEEEEESLEEEKSRIYDLNLHFHQHIRSFNLLQSHPICVIHPESYRQSIPTLIASVWPDISASNITIMTFNFMFDDDIEASIAAIQRNSNDRVTTSQHVIVIQVLGYQASIERTLKVLFSKQCRGCLTVLVGSESTFRNGFQPSFLSNAEKIYRSELDLQSEDIVNLQEFDILSEIQKVGAENRPLAMKICKILQTVHLEFMIRSQWTYLGLASFISITLADFESVCQFVAQMFTHFPVCDEPEYFPSLLLHYLTTFVYGRYIDHERNSRLAIALLKHSVQSAFEGSHRASVLQNDFSISSEENNFLSNPHQEKLSQNVSRFCQATGVYYLSHAFMSQLLEHSHLFRHSFVAQYAQFASDYQSAQDINRSIQCCFTSPNCENAASSQHFLRETHLELVKYLRSCFLRIEEKCNHSFTDVEKQHNMILPEILVEFQATSVQLMDVSKRIEELQKWLLEENRTASSLDMNLKHEAEMHSLVRNQFPSFWPSSFLSSSANKALDFDSKHDTLHDMGRSKTLSMEQWMQFHFQKLHYHYNALAFHLPASIQLQYFQLKRLIPRLFLYSAKVQHCAPDDLRLVLLPDQTEIQDSPFRCHNLILYNQEEEPCGIQISGIEFFQVAATEDGSTSSSSAHAMIYSFVWMKKIELSKSYPRNASNAIISQLPLLVTPSMSDYLMACRESSSEFIEYVHVIQEQEQRGPSLGPGQGLSSPSQEETSVILCPVFHIKILEMQSFRPVRDSNQEL